MDKYFKEFTIIDYIGIALPGIILFFFVFDTETVVNFFNNMFAFDISQEMELLVYTIILIIMGYITGVILHELMDLLEKQFTKVVIFNPKIYALKNFSNENINKILIIEDYDKNEKCKINFLTLVKHFINCFKYKQLILITLICVVFSLLVTLWFFDSSIGLIIGIITFLSILSIILHNYKKLWTKFKTNDIKNLLVNHNINILLTQSHSKGNTNKKEAFKGFSIMARNLISVIIIVRFFYIEKLSEITEINSTFYMISFIVVIFLFIRYFRNACHYYKYNFEDYIASK